MSSDKLENQINPDGIKIIIYECLTQIDNYVELMDYNRHNFPNNANLSIWFSRWENVQGEIAPYPGSRIVTFHLDFDWIKLVGNYPINPDDVISQLEIKLYCSDKDEIDPVYGVCKLSSVLVLFKDDISEQQARDIVKKTDSCAFVTKSFWFIKTLAVATLPFDEKKFIQKIQNAHNVVGELDGTVRAIEPGFRWNSKKILERQIEWPPIKDKSYPKWKSETLGN